MRIRYLPALAGLAMVIPLALGGPSASGRAAGPVQESGNWAGYGDIGGRYHQVEAVWKVPSIPATKSKAYAYFWVGIGGMYGGSLLNEYIFGSGLAQIGVAEASGGGQVNYYPFWELIPRTDRSQSLPSSQPHFFRNSHGQLLSVKPGDYITASVSLSGGTYYMRMSDGRGTNNTIWTTRPVPASGSELANDSAEVVMEDPTGTTLADFGRVFFDGVTIDGKPIGATSPDEIVLSPNPYGVTESIIGANGDSFSIGTPPSSPPPSPPPSAPAVPVITSVSTYTVGALVYFDIQYADPGNDAAGFGFVGVNGSGWAEENHPFSSPSYGIVGPDSISYPFNQACGTAQQYDSYVQAWIYDTAGQRSNPVTIHLVCSSSGSAG